MEVDITAQFACPICRAIPPTEIFQCKNGHIICSDCASTTFSCPKCKVLLGNDRIRNLALEVILDSKTFPCFYKHLGCGLDLSRAEMPEHLRNCDFREITVPLCSILGLDCKFMISDKKISDAIDHFKAVHNSPCHPGGTGKIKMEGFDETNFTENKAGCPVILENGTDKIKAMSIAKVNGDDQTVSMITMLLGAPPEATVTYSAQYTLSGNNDGIFPMKWTTPCVSIVDSEASINSPIFRTPSSIIKEKYLRNGNLELSVVIKTDAEVDTNLCSVSGSIHTEADSSTVAQGSAGDIYVGDDIQCDVCKIKPITGTRHNCLQCVNYDLCDNCRDKGEHAHHLFTEVKNHFQHKALHKLKHDPILKGWKALVSGDVLVEGPVQGN